MVAPGILTGGGKRSIFRDPSIEPYGPEALTRQGVFGPNPGSTSKFAINRGRRDSEYVETMARLFIEVPGPQQEAFLKTVSERALPLAKMLLSGTGTGGVGATGFIDFLLTNSNENFQEKTQIVDTLTDNYVAFYSGEEPPLFQYSGVLLNTYQDDQRVWMLTMYRELLRGTRLAGRNRTVNLRYDSFLVTGYMESLNLSLSGETEHTASQFTFTLRVKRMEVMTKAYGAPTTLLPTTSEYLGSVVAGGELVRVGSTTTDVPPTAINVPAADRTVANNAKLSEDRAALLAAGKTPEEIDAAYTLANITRDNTVTDERAVAEIKAAGGTNRPAEHVQGTATAITNPNSATSDAANNRTNVKGTVPGTEQTTLTKRKGARKRSQ